MESPSSCHKRTEQCSASAQIDEHTLEIPLIEPAGFAKRIHARIQLMWACGLYREYMIRKMLHGDLKRSRIYYFQAETRNGSAANVGYAGEEKLHVPLAAVIDLMGGVTIETLNTKT